MFFRCIATDMAAILKNQFLRELPPQTYMADYSLPTPLASLRDLALMKLIAVNQRGACKDFVDLKFIMENTGLTLKVLLNDLSRNRNKR